jgi:hypothetical protein
MKMDEVRKQTKWVLKVEGDQEWKTAHATHWAAGLDAISCPCQEPNPSLYRAVTSNPTHDVPWRGLPSQYSCTVLVPVWRTFWWPQMIYSSISWCETIVRFLFRSMAPPNDQIEFIILNLWTIKEKASRHDVPTSLNFSVQRFPSRTERRAP